jgi:Ni/Co efflux regulator RcnB
MNTRFAAALLLSCTLASTSVLAQSPNRDDHYRSQEQNQRRDRNQEQNRRGDDRAQAQRQDDRRYDRRDDRRDDRRYDRRDDRHDDRRDDRRGDRRDDRAYYGASRFHRGERLPTYYRDHVFVVDHWQAHKLHRPPRGHQWVQVGGDYVLVAITTGIIASIILNH